MPDQHSFKHLERHAWALAGGHAVAPGGAG